VHRKTCKHRCHASTQSFATCFPAWHATAADGMSHQTLSGVRAGPPHANPV
jgi:hypothetical protein